MWWGGFSEAKEFADNMKTKASLNPHVVGRFFRVDYLNELATKYKS